MKCFAAGTLEVAEDLDHHRRLGLAERIAVDVRSGSGHQHHPPAKITANIFTPFISFLLRPIWFPFKYINTNRGYFVTQDSPSGRTDGPFKPRFKKDLQRALTTCQIRRLTLYWYAI